jgi:hypothetical protein
MAHAYEVEHSNGKKYTVTTDRHHADHNDSDFKEHLHNVIQNTFSTVVGGMVLRYIFKGRV